MNDEIRYNFDTEGAMVPVGRLKTHPHNANRGDVEAIKASILRNGVFRRLPAQVSTGYVLDGNHTFEALLDLGAQFVPIEWNDVDDAAALRILLTANKTARLAHMDKDAEFDLLRRVMEDDPDLGLLGTGYQPKEFLKMIEGDAPPEVTPEKGAEDLIHTITCPKCQHTWRRGHDDLDGVSL